MPVSPNGNGHGALRTGSLDTLAPADAEDADATVAGALARPYTVERWREDLRALGAGAPTGFDALEDVGMRWHPGKVYAIIARPGGGKTAFMLEALLRYVEAHPDRLGAFFSWEEPLADLVLRIVLREDARRFRAVGYNTSFGSALPLYGDRVREWARGDAVDQQWADRIAVAVERVQPLLARLRLVDGDTVGQDTGRVLHDVARWTREQDTPLGLVAVDYFQKLRGRGDAHSRQVELQAVSNLIRRFAKGGRLVGDEDREELRYAVPVLVGAQVTRGGEKEEREHPSGDRVREADDLLNDASALIALSWESLGGERDDQQRALRVSVPKHRGGRARPTEVAHLLWHPARAWIATTATRGDKGQIRWKPIADLGAEPATEGTDPRKNGKPTTAPRVVD
jgi:replicative DNA helicase